MALGRLDQAVAEQERALEFDPLSPEVHFWLSWTLFLNRRHDCALAVARRLVELEPQAAIPRMVLGVVLLAAGRFDDSSAALREAAAISNEFPLVLGWLGLTLGLGGAAPKPGRCSTACARSPGSGSHRPPASAGSTRPRRD